MKYKYLYISIFVILSLVAILLVWKYTFRKSETSVENQKAEVTIQAVKLLEAFESNENNANSLYLGKIIAVTGIVESVTTDTLGVSIYLKDTDALAGIICSFNNISIDTSMVEKGKEISIKGICSGYLMDVIMNKCSLEPNVKP